MICVGENHGRAKLTATQVRAIRARYKWHDHTDGAAAIARDYGRGLTTIRAIVNGDTWKCLLS